MLCVMYMWRDASEERRGAPVVVVGGGGGGLHAHAAPLHRDKHERGMCGCLVVHLGALGLLRIKCARKGKGRGNILFQGQAQATSGG